MSTRSFNNFKSCLTSITHYRCRRWLNSFGPTSLAIWTFRTSLPKCKISRVEFNWANSAMRRSCMMFYSRETWCRARSWGICASLLSPRVKNSTHPGVAASSSGSIWERRSSSSNLSSTTRCSRLTPNTTSTSGNRSSKSVWASWKK